MKNINKILIIFVIIFSLAFASGCSLVLGKSAYEIAVDNGFVGTELQWLQTLKGDYAGKGKSAYEIALDNGFVGTEVEWLLSLKGDTGNAGIGGAGGGAVTAGVNKAVLSAVSVYANFNVGGQTKRGAGAGVVFAHEKALGNAYIITNYHVVYDKGGSPKISNSILVYLYGQEFENYAIPATYVGGSMTYDIAVLKIENSLTYSESLAQTVEVKNSEEIVIGEIALAVGNPKASGISASSGIVSVDSEHINMKASDEVTDIEFRVIRMDTAVNSGNSGGGLFNEQGQLIGIVNAKMVVEDIENIAYAIPSNIAINVANNIIKNASTKKVQRVMLGIEINIASSMLQINEETGLVNIVQAIGVNDVTPTSSALGVLQQGDIIISAEYLGKVTPINRLFTLVDLGLTFKAGDVLTLTIERSGSVLEVEVPLVNVVEID